MGHSISADMRQHLRYQYPTAKHVTFSVRNDETGSVYHAIVNDISLGGISLITAAHLQPQQSIELSIDAVPPIVGEVVRSCNGITGIKFASPISDLEQTIEPLRLSASCA